MLLCFLFVVVDNEGRNVDDEFRAANEGEKFLYHLGVVRLVGLVLARVVVLLVRVGVVLAFVQEK